MTLTLDDTAPVLVGQKRWLIGLTREEIGQALIEVGVPARGAKMRANQLWHWIYYRGARSFADMTTISKDLRADLEVGFHLGRGTEVDRQVSQDRTRKWLLSYGANQEIETVFIPETDRGALCVSSQVCCTLNCRFCHTGTQPWVKNLSAGEIVAQLLHASDYIGEWPSPTEGRMISNIVLMGMGEPLYNYDNVAKALRIVMDQEGIGISRRRITLSTSGVVPEIARVGEDLGIGLAISLHAVRDDLRDELVPPEPQIPHQRFAQRLPPLSDQQQCTPHHLRIRHAQRGQRHPGRRPRTGASAPGNPSQGESDPVQRVARRALRMFRRGRHRRLRRDRQQRGLFLADPHAARPRHHGRLRPAQVVQRQTAGQRNSLRADLPSWRAPELQTRR